MKSEEVPEESPKSKGIWDYKGTVVSSQNIFFSSFSYVLSLSHHRADGKKSNVPSKNVSLLVEVYNKYLVGIISVTSAYSLRETMT